MDSVTITPFQAGNNIRIKWKQLPIITQCVITAKLKHTKYAILVFRVGIGIFAPSYVVTPSYDMFY